ncbi:hypothetical protein ACFFX0_26285 [Citricoccus parietis]|uniref:Uncharacterized protein n=1 Tax=Citricoccus parietis TaxID=592307 RepID=A0ABV5G6I7_9MICC
MDANCSPGTNNASAQLSPPCWPDSCPRRRRASSASSDAWPWTSTVLNPAPTPARPWTTCRDAWRRYRSCR